MRQQRGRGTHTPRLPVYKAAGRGRAGEGQVKGGGSEVRGEGSEGSVLWPSAHYVCKKISLELSITSYLYLCL